MLILFKGTIWQCHKPALSPLHGPDTAMGSFLATDEAEK